MSAETERKTIIEPYLDALLQVNHTGSIILWASASGILTAILAALWVFAGFDIWIGLGTLIFGHALNAASVVREIVYVARRDN